MELNPSHASRSYYQIKTGLDDWFMPMFVSGLSDLKSLKSAIIGSSNSMATSECRNGIWEVPKWHAQASRVLFRVAPILRCCLSPRRRHAHTHAGGGLCVCAARLVRSAVEAARRPFSSGGSPPQGARLGFGSCAEWDADRLRLLRCALQGITPSQLSTTLNTSPQPLHHNARSRLSSHGPVRYPDR